MDGLNRKMKKARLWMKFIGLNDVRNIGMNNEDRDR